jgi:hypothetical protein
MGAITVIATIITGCYSHKERIVERERERPVVREQIIEKSSPSTTVETPDTTVKVK